MPSNSFATLQDWLDWQETLHPSEIDLGLERVQQVLHNLLPQCFSLAAQSFPFTVVTIAGTNGKGSTVAMLEAIFSEAGYRVGSYTSPHLIQYNERIKINQKPVSDQVICDAFARIDNAREEQSISYFEFATLAAIDVFYNHQCEIVILEVGLGGRLDAVNVIDPDIALISTVDIDHQEWLGSDRNAIGLEKAGIYRPDIPVIYGDDELPDSIQNKVIQEGLTFYQYSKDYQFSPRGEQWDWLPVNDNSLFEPRYNLPLPRLFGSIQLKNASNVLFILEQLKDSYPVSQAEIKRGLQKTELAGRFQVFSADPFIILDVAHNPQAAKVLCQAIKQLSVPGQLNVIVGMLKDKDISEVLSILLPVVDNWRIIDLDTPRAMPAIKIKQLLLSLLQEQPHKNSPADVNIHCFDGFEQAYQDFASYNSTSKQLEKLVIFGSFFTVSDALNSLNHLNNTLHKP